MSDRGTYAVTLGDGLFIGFVLFTVPIIFDALKERQHLKEIRSVTKAGRAERKDWR